MSNVTSILRSKLDGSDNFVSGGHGIISTAGATLHASRMKRVPVWALDDEKVKEILLKAFPKMMSDSKQRIRALLWLKIIHLYWRAGLTCSQVAHETGKSDKQIKNYLRSINMVAAGRCAHGQERGLRKRGRPKKIVSL